VSEPRSPKASDRTKREHMTNTAKADRSPWAVFLVFLRLGLTSFGGPVAHLGYFRDEFVTRRQWLTERSYADLVALCQFLPGPASSQVGIALGLSRSATRRTGLFRASRSVRYSPDSVSQGIAVTGMSSRLACSRFESGGRSVVRAGVMGDGRNPAQMHRAHHKAAAASSFFCGRPMGQWFIVIAAVIGILLFKPHRGSHDPLPIVMSVVSAALAGAVFCPAVGLAASDSTVPVQTLGHGRSFLRAGSRYLAEGLSC